MTKTVEYFFDFGSPAAYLASTQLPALAAQTGATVLWRPMLLGGVFVATGNTSPASVPAKGKYIFRDFARFAQRYGVPLKFNPFFPINTITLMRIAAGLQLRQDARFADYCSAMFGAVAFIALGFGLAFSDGGGVMKKALWGKLSDKIGRLTVMLISIFITALSYLVFSQASTIPLLIFARGLSGIGSANIAAHW